MGLHRFRVAAVRVALAVLMGLTIGSASAQGRELPVSAYKDVSLAINPSNPRIASSVEAGVPALLPNSQGQLPGALGALTWAFATGECGQERWGSFDTEAFARSNVQAFVAAGVGYMVATGGQAGAFTCASDQDMARFIARYDSPRLLGFDFDIEGEQTAEQVRSLAQRVRHAQGRRPGLQWRFTLATHAASDGSGRSLNRTGEMVLAAVREAGLVNAVINLMVMDYGPAEASVCVLRPDGRCDMGASALQAARNVYQRHGVQLAQIALTPMLGVNDVRENVFSVADAQHLAAQARALGLAGVHFWSLDRDRACGSGADGTVSALCHGLPGLAPLTFSRAFQTGAKAQP